ncbi:MAG TPA: hypothetical protein VGD60_10840 [Candidatus Acidoferrales bacterium]
MRHRKLLNRRTTSFLVLFFLVCGAGLAQEPAATSALELLDHLAGRWVLQGTIGGKPTTHDVQAEWVLKREYLRLHEVSREKDAKGDPAYEAIVLISWDQKTQQYTCMWLDSTAGGGLSAEGLAHGKKSGDSIPFLFTIPPADYIHTTFAYDPGTDTWKWLIDVESNGKTDHFADVKLSRAH